jgi:Putative Ig domain/FG-GAP-like repeat/Domain of unknown function (DUF4114)
MANEQVKFRSAASFPVVDNPFSATVGDFNRDGNADLAVNNYDTANVSVLLGNGQGGFSPATNFAVGAKPFTIVTADFNSDGKADLVTSGYKDGKISLLLGNGNGSFQAVREFAVGTELIDVALGDFNGDGKPDLAVADDGSNLAVLIGDGNGGFGTPIKLATETSPISISVGDANGDGKSDLIAANSGSNNLSILFGDGKGGFGAVNNVDVGTESAIAVVGDFNRDGIPDLASDNYEIDSIGILLGTGNGKFAAPTNFAVGDKPFSLTVKDLNGDGIVDISTANNLDNSISVLLGNGTGGFAPVKNFNVGNNPGFSTVGDFNNDGRFDLVAVNRGSDNASVLLNETIATTIINRSPVVANPTSNKTIVAGTALNFTLAANTFTDPDAGDVLSYSAKLANGNQLPTWLTFNPTTRAFAGTPAAANVGELGIMVNATDKGGLTVSDNFNLVVSPIVITPSIDPVNLPPIGTKSQKAPEGRTIDLSDYNGKALKADIKTQGDAAYTNNIGFYLVEDSIGSIKMANGSLVKPGDANYAIEAIKGALLNSLQAAKIDNKTNLDLTGGRIYAPVVVAQGSLTDFINKNPTNGGGADSIHAYFNYIGANPDKIDHFRLNGNNSFAVEDQFGGGDRDFNDLVVTMNLRTV